MPVLKYIDYAWRLAMTGFASLLFSLGGLFMVACVFPVVTWGTCDRRRRRDCVQGLVQKSFRLWLAAAKAVGILELEISGRERLENCTGRLVIANHPTLLDVVILMSVLPRAQCVVKHSLWRHRFYGGVVRAADYIRSDEDPDVLIGRCVQSLAEGNNLIVFPEGSRTVPGRPMKFKRGVANIIAQRDVMVELVTISCVPATLAKGSRWFHIPDRKPRFRIAIEPCFDLKAELENANRPLATRAITRKLESHFLGKLHNGLAYDM